MADLRMGIIGIGNMGSAHFSFVSTGKIEGMTLAAVCDLRQERLDFCKENAPGISKYSTVSIVSHLSYKLLVFPKNFISFLKKIKDFSTFTSPV